MAYIVGVSTVEDTASSVVIPLPVGVEADDQILLLCSQDGGGTAIASTGYSDVPGTSQVDQSGSRAAALIKRAGASEANPVVTGANNEWAVICVVIRGADTTAPIDIAAQADATTGTPTCPSVMPTSGGGLVIRAMGGNDSSNSEPYIPASISQIAYLDNTTHTIAGSEKAPNSGPTGVFEFLAESPVDGSSCYTIVFSDASPDDNTIGYHQPYNVVRYYSSVEVADTFTDIASSLSILNGKSVVSGAGLPTYSQEYAEFTSGSVGIGVLGVTHAISPTNFSGKIITITMGPDRPGSSITGEDGTYIVLFDSAGSWSAFNIPQSVMEQVGSAISAASYELFFHESSTPLDSSGTLDWTDIVKLGYAWDKKNTQVAARPVRFKQLFILDSAVVYGGAVNNPVTPSKIAGILDVYNSQGFTGVQGLGQALLKQEINIGDGANDVYYVNSTESWEYPAETNDQFIVGSGVIDVVISASANSTVDFSASINRTDKEQNFTIDPSSSTSATYNFNGWSCIGYKVIWKTGINPRGATFISSGLIDIKAATFTNCTFRDSRETAHDLAILAGGALVNCEFIKGDATYAIEIPASGSYDFTDTTWAGYTTDLNVTAASGTVTITLSAGQAQPTFTTAGATVTFVQPTTTFTINSSESGSLIQIFTTDTQTILDGTTGTSLAYDHTGETVDYVVQKAGFIPQRFTSVTLSGTSSVTVNLVASREYDASHGLTYATDASWDRTSNQLTVPTFGPTVQGVFSLMIDSFISQPSLRNTAFNLEMDGVNSLYLVNDAEGVNDATIQNMTRGGVGYISTSGATKAEWFGVLSIGDNTTGQTGEYQQIDGSGTTDARATGSFDEIIKMYGDASHGNFDYRDHAVFKYQINGFYQARVDVLDTFGISQLEPTLYVIPLNPQATGLATGDPAISITITDHTAAPITVGGKQFDYEVVDNGANSAEDILREINYNLSLDATYQGKDPFNWPDAVINVGSTYETERGPVEGQDTTTTQHGFYVSRGGNDHPDFTRFQSNDGTYYVAPVLASASITGITAGSRLRIYNQTTDTETYNDIVAGTSYSDTYTEGTTYSAGDVIEVYLAYQSGTTAKLNYTNQTVAASSGWSIIANQQDDTVYALNGIDGSTLTEFSADYADGEIDITSAGVNYSHLEAYAWWVYNLTTELGIRNFFGGVTAEDAANYRNNVNVVSIFWDNLVSTNKSEVTGTRFYRTDGVWPVKNNGATTGGGGMSFNWLSEVYLATTGSGPLTAAQEAQLASAASNSATAVTSTNLLINDQGLNLSAPKVITEVTEGESYTESVDGVTKTIVKSGSTTTVTRTA